MTRANKRRAGEILARAQREGRPLTREEFRAVSAVPLPTEHDEQARLIRRLGSMRHAHPDLALLAAVPNAGGHGDTHRGRGLKMLAEGLLPGYPDLLLDSARGGYFGLRLELKRSSTYGTKAGEPRPTQQAIHGQLRAAGYLVVVCWSPDAAFDVILWYLRQPRTVPRDAPEASLPVVRRARYVSS